LLISETHITLKNYFTIPGYKLCHTNHPDGTAHGSTALLTKDTIMYCELLKYKAYAIQATSIKEQGILHEITIAAVYCTPRYNLKKDQFETFFSNVKSEIHSRWRLQQQKHLMGFIPNNNERTRTIHGAT
jgi:hypothetical protein